jgi:hypothetical protein
MGKVEEVMEAEAQKKVKDISEAGTYFEGRYIPGLDAEYELLEAESDAIVGAEKSIKESVSDLEKVIGGKITDPSKFSKEEIESYH